VFTDPLIGYWSDRVKQSLSRQKQIVIGVVLLILFINPLFSPPTDTVSWLQLFSLSFLSYFAWTLIQVPYLALAAEIIHNKPNNTLLITAREGFAIFGVLLMLILPFILDQSVTETAFYKNFLLLFSVLILLTAFWLYYLPTTRNHKAESSESVTESAIKHPLEQIKTIKSKHPEALLILPPYFLNNLANAIPATLFLFFVEQFLSLKDATGEFLLAYFMAGIISLPIWLKLANKFGRIRVWRASILLAVSSFAAVFWLEPGNYNLYMAICILTGLSLAIDIALPASIQTEIGQQVQQQTQNLNGLLFGIWGMLTKFSLALAVGFSLPLLDLAKHLQLDSNISLLLLYALPAILLKIWVWKQLSSIKSRLQLDNL